VADFYLFTKTVWDEPPRLRHQVAQLLAAAGHEVLFFQKPGYGREAATQLMPGITGVRTRYLLHAQLRILPQLATANAAVECREIRRIAREPPRIGIVNFNFDYDFLRTLYPRARLLTIINDDFVEAARPVAREAVRRALRATARVSDGCAAVSYPLVDQLRAWTDRVSLFLPWSRGPYVQPRLQRARPDVLYWGYIGGRIDFAAVRHILDSGIRIHFVGPLTPSIQVSEMLRHPNAEYRPAASLSEIEDVLDRCCASLLAYDLNFTAMKALTASNRSFELLSRGLPLLYPALPALLESPPGVTYRCQSPQAYVEAIRSAQAAFDAVQPSIEQYLEAHTAARRYRQLMEFFE
jgi:hypothetical protein